MELDNESALRLLGLASSVRDLLPKEELQELETFRPGVDLPWFEISDSERQRLGEITDRTKKAIQEEIAAKAGRFFDDEAQKLDHWAEDLRSGLEREIRELDQQIRNANRAKTSAKSLETKLEFLKQIKTLENERKEKRRTIYEAQDEIDQRRDALIAEIESRLGGQVEMKELFSIRFVVDSAPSTW